MGDPLLFADNVRTEIVMELGVMSTSHSLSDYILMKHSKQKDSRFDTLKFVMEDVTERLLFRTRTVTKLCDKFSEFDENNDGYLDFDEFCKAFKRNPRENLEMRHLFRLFNTKSMWKQEDISEFMEYDKIRQKKIGFEDFLVGISVCFVDSMIDDAV